MVGLCMMAVTYLDMTHNNTKKDKKLHCGCLRSEDHNRRWKYISSFSHYKHSIRIVFLSVFLHRDFLHMSQLAVKSLLSLTYSEDIEIS